MLKYWLSGITIVVVAFCFLYEEGKYAREIKKMCTTNNVFKRVDIVKESETLGSSTMNWSMEEVILAVTSSLICFFIGWNANNYRNWKAQVKPTAERGSNDISDINNVQSEEAIRSNQTTEKESKMQDLPGVYDCGDIHQTQGQVSTRLPDVNNYEHCPEDKPVGLSICNSGGTDCEHNAEDKPMCLLSPGSIDSEGNNEEFGQSIKFQDDSKQCLIMNCSMKENCSLSNVVEANQGLVEENIYPIKINMAEYAVIGGCVGKEPVKQQEESIERIDVLKYSLGIGVGKDQGVPSDKGFPIPQEYSLNMRSNLLSQITTQKQQQQNTRSNEKETNVDSEITEGRDGLDTKEQAQVSTSLPEIGYCEPCPFNLSVCNPDVNDYEHNTEYKPIKLTSPEVPYYEAHNEKPAHISKHLEDSSKNCLLINCSTNRNILDSPELSPLRSFLEEQSPKRTIIEDKICPTELDIVERPFTTRCIEKENIKQQDESITILNPVEYPPELGVREVPEAPSTKGRRIPQYHGLRKRPTTLPSESNQSNPSKQTPDVRDNRRRRQRQQNAKS